MLLLLLPPVRSKDVIKSGGEWISSIALENAAAGHPKVRRNDPTACLHLVVAATHLQQHRLEVSVEESA
jgi:acyl-CoA synthetase (AMP-forming)/AMP-acid ligase II